MLLRLPKPAARLAIVVFAFGLAATLAFFSIRNARAASQAGLGTLAGYEAAARLEPDNAEAFSRCWRVNPDVGAILDNVIPPNRAAYLAVIFELVNADQLPETLAVWQRLVSMHPRMSPADVISFTDFLLQKGDLDDAHRVWQDALLLSDVVASDPPGSILWDGGFESNVRGGGCAGAFGEHPPAVQFGLDP